MENSRVRSWVEIDLAALRHNASVVSKRIGEAKIMAVVKANAYGHGAIPVAKALSRQVAFFGVANVTEALELRDAGIQNGIFILGTLLPEERMIAAQKGFVVPVSNREEAQAFAKLRAEVHLVIDTGMGRIGVSAKDAVGLARKIAALSGSRLTGMMTHLPSADEDAGFTRKELAVYADLTSQIKAAVPSVYLSHVLNSAGVLAFPESRQDMVRVGLMLYGASPLPEYQPLLRPVLTWKTRISLIREVPPGTSVSYGRTFIAPRAMRIATLGVGYADGYPRLLSKNHAEVLIAGHHCPLLGRVTMDQILVDITTLPEVKVGEEAVLLGKQGKEEIDATTFALKSQTIAWEIFTGIQNRVERRYRQIE